MPAPQLAHRLLDLHVIGLDSLNGKRFAQIEGLAGVEAVVGEHEAGNELNEVGVGGAGGDEACGWPQIQRPIPPSAPFG